MTPVHDQLLIQQVVVNDEYALGRLQIHGLVNYYDSSVSKRMPDFKPFIFNFIHLEAGVVFPETGIAIWIWECCG
jgi:hypothetical protein